MSIQNVSSNFEKQSNKTHYWDPMIEVADQIRNRVLWENQPSTTLRQWDTEYSIFTARFLELCFEAK